MTEGAYTADSDFVCGWETESCCNVALLEADPVVAQRCVNVAAEVLYALSGRQFGLCELTVRPCRPRCYDYDPRQMTGWRWTPVLVGGQWTNVACFRCGDLCSCKEVSDVVLPGPIQTVSEVKLDGEVLDPDAYRVDNNRTLVRVDGSRWPVCQDMTVDDTEDGTWSVTYDRGWPLPEAGKAALTEFAGELVKACSDDRTCSLPARVTNVTRQGISYTILDPMTFITEGRTGLYLVDAWLATVNPKARTRRAGIYSPDVPRPRSTTS